jgi:hypothetical protein
MNAKQHHVVLGMKCVLQCESVNGINNHKINNKKENKKSSLLHTFSIIFWHFLDAKKALLIQTEKDIY